MHVRTANHRDAQNNVADKSPGDVKWLEALPKRRMWHFKVELLRLGLSTINSRDRQCLAPQTNRPRQSTVIEWLPYRRIGRIRVQTPDTWWHTSHRKPALYRELG
jgi:hypothetical protein